MNNNSKKQKQAVIIAFRPKQTTQSVSIGREFSSNPNYFTIA